MEEKRKNVAKEVYIYLLVQKNFREFSVDNRNLICLNK